MNLLTKNNFSLWNPDKPSHAKLSRRISERLDGRTSMKISDKYEINENDFEATESGNVF